jgi:hypothetical protein
MPEVARAVTGEIVPVPFPSADDVDLQPPDRDQVMIIAAGMASAAAPPDGLTHVQRAVLEALTESMTGVAVDLASIPGIEPRAFAEAIARKDLAFRTRMVQGMLLAEMLLVPIPPSVTARVEEYAAHLGVGDEMMRVVRRIANGSLGLALIDFERSGYFERLLEDAPPHLHLSETLDDAWERCCADDTLFERWAALEQCAPDTLGRKVWEFYRARGFTFPGRMGSAPPTLAQHDWIHVLADYGSTVESEIEVFGLISRCNDDPEAFALLAMVLGLFETGYLYGAARGFFEYDRGHISRDIDQMAVRLADAMARGARLAWHLDDTGRSDRTDLLATDWFEYADVPVDDVRADLGLPPRSERAIAAGSKTPWEAGGISPFQAAQGRAGAETDGRRYESYGADPAA